MPSRWFVAKKRGKNGQGIGNVTPMCKISRVSLLGGGVEESPRGFAKVKRK